MNTGLPETFFKLSFEHFEELTLRCWVKCVEKVHHSLRRDSRNCSHSSCDSIIWHGISQYMIVECIEFFEGSRYL